MKPFSFNSALARLRRAESRQRLAWQRGTPVPRTDLPQPACEEWGVLSEAEKAANDRDYSRRLSERGSR